MVTIKQATATADLVGARRHPCSRLPQLDAAAAAAGKMASSQQKAARRPDQRSTISIAGSSHSTSGRQTVHQRVGNNGSRAAATVAYAAATAKSDIRRTTPKIRWPHQLGKMHHSAGGTGVGCRGTYGANSVNSVASNSAGEVLPRPVRKSRASSAARAEDDAQSLGSRVSCATHQQLGKTVSISASHDQTASTHFGQSDAIRRPIIKLKPLPKVDHTWGMHNNNSEAPRTPRTGEPGMTPHKLREQKIFEECRFVPRDPFYKNVLVAPNRNRQFFWQAAPNSFRRPGYRTLYDIANQNTRHHRDVNIDFTRNDVKRYCPNFCRPSHFRHLD